MLRARGPCSGAGDHAPSQGTMAHSSSIRSMVPRLGEPRRAAPLGSAGVSRERCRGGRAAATRSWEPCAERGHHAPWPAGSEHGSLVRSMARWFGAWLRVLEHGPDETNLHTARDGATPKPSAPRLGLALRATPSGGSARWCGGLGVRSRASTGPSGALSSKGRASRGLWRAKPTRLLRLRAQGPFASAQAPHTTSPRLAPRRHAWRWRAYARPCDPQVHRAVTCRPGPGRVQCDSDHLVGQAATLLLTARVVALPLRADACSPGRPGGRHGEVAGSHAANGPLGLGRLRPFRAVSLRNPASALRRPTPR